VSACARRRSLEVSGSKRPPPATQSLFDRAFRGSGRVRSFSDSILHGWCSARIRCLPMLKRAYPGHLCRFCDGRGMHLDPEAGPWFRAMRLQAGISQTAMAAALGKRQQRVCDWEAGRLTIPPRIAERWELLCEERTQASSPTRPPREACEREAPHTPPQQSPPPGPPGTP